MGKETLRHTITESSTAFRRKVWILNPYGTLPSEGWRSTRTVLLARTLVEFGFDVTWFLSAFCHSVKRTRSSETSPAEELGIKIRFVKACSYSKNISFRRVLSEALFAARLLRNCRAEQLCPDVIIAGHATLFSGMAAALLARYYRVPLVIDMFDLWPEVFHLALPKRLQVLAPFVFGPLYLWRKMIFRQADAVIALASINLEVASAIAEKASPERCILVYEGIDASVGPGTSEPLEFLPATVSVAQGGATPVRVVYAGTFGEGYDIGTIVAAAGVLKKRGVAVAIILAGDGPGRAMLEAAIASDPSLNLVYVGRLSPQQLSRLYRDSQVGLCTYSPGSTVAMPCKVYDYLSGGLAIVSSLPGELAEFLAEKQIGLQYQSGSAESLADAIGELVADPVRLDVFRNHARSQAPQFDRRVQYSKVVRLLDDLVPRSGAVRESETSIA
jgi:glycosyltransferase involved in cell wall biosynthesis